MNFGARFVGGEWKEMWVAETSGAALLVVTGSEEQK